jgi:hypothetical protein
MKMYTVLCSLILVSLLILCVQGEHGALSQSPAMEERIHPACCERLMEEKRNGDCTRDKPANYSYYGYVHGSSSR